MLENWPLGEAERSGWYAQAGMWWRKPPEGAGERDVVAAGMARRGRVSGIGGELRLRIGEAFGEAVGLAIGVTCGSDRQQIAPRPGSTLHVRQGRCHPITVPSGAIRQVTG